MISRKTTIALAELIEVAFTRVTQDGELKIASNELYDFLYVRDYSQGFCASARIWAETTTVGVPY